MKLIWFTSKRGTVWQVDNLHTDADRKAWNSAGKMYQLWPHHALYFVNTSNHMWDGVSYDKFIKSL